MATPVVPSQFAVGKNRIIHKPTTATFSFETELYHLQEHQLGACGRATIIWPTYRRDDIIRVAQQLLSKLPR
jgi:hypothetical protein